MNQWYDILQSVKNAKGKEKENFKRFRDKSFDSAPIFKKKKRDISWIQNFRCDKFGHFPRDCNMRPKLYHGAVVADVENSSPQKESSNNFEGFLLISALSSNIPTNSDT